MDKIINQLVQKTGLFITALLGIFLVLGVAVIIGMRSEVSTIINNIFSGTIKLIELVEFLTKIWERFLQLLKEALLFVSPALAALTGLFGYVTLLALYKYIGVRASVTLLTVVLTVFLALVPLIIWPPKEQEQPISSLPGSFWDVWRSKMSLYLLNAYELMLFAFFLTLDWEKPFFLPSSLWGDIKANLGSLDLMVRGFNYHDAFIFTLWLAGLAVLLEVFRQLLKVVLRAVRMQSTSRTASTASRLESFRECLKISFNDNLDDLVRFVGYTTLVIAVFFLFPRLKLLSLVVFSATTLLWDAFHPHRFFVERKNKDMLSLAAEKILNR